MLVDRIYFGLKNYSPSDILGITFSSRSDNPIPNSDEVIEKIVYKIPGFTLVYSEHLNNTVVNGSLRKFYFGVNSIKDFEDEKQLEHAFILLSKELKISYSTLLKCEVYSIEIGKNFIIDESVSAIINSIKKFSVLKPKRYSESLTFIGSQYDFIIYDKIEEIKNKIGKYGISEIIRNTGNKQYIRLELRLKTKQAIKNKLSKETETIHDILRLCQFFPYVLFHEIKRLEFIEEQLSSYQSFHGKTYKEFTDHLCSLGISYFGLDNALNVINTLKGVNKTYYRNQIKRLSYLVKLKMTLTNIDLLESFREQLNLPTDGIIDAELLDI
ncbi:MAG: hypothetical protein U0T07_07020 [Chitinophagales bacterium]